MTSLGPMTGVVPVGGTSITFEWIPRPEEVANRIFQLAEQLEDMSVPLAISRGIAIADTREHFTKQQSPSGEAWAPWAPSYAKKAASQNVGKILQRTMSLQEAATDPAAYIISNDSLFFSTAGLPEYWIWNYAGTVGEGVDIAFMREFSEDPATGKMARGTTGVGRGHALPPREMVGISYEAQLQILETFEAWFNGAINTAVVRGGRSYGAFRDPATGRFGTAP